MNNYFNIVQYFFEAAQKYPDKVAIIKDKDSITFGRLAEQVEQTSTYFTRKGIVKGDHVLVFVPMGINLYRILLSLFNIGATAVFLDEWVNKKRMELCCEVAQCKVFIGTHKFLMFSVFSKALSRIPIKLSTSFSKQVVDRLPSVYVEREDTALLTFTTGSTGVPKAAKRTHGFLNEQLKALIEKINPHADDVDLVTLPIVLLVNLGVGCTSVIANHKAKDPASFKGKQITAQLFRYNVTRCIASPYFALSLSKYLSEQSVIGTALNNLFVGGAPVFPIDALTLQKSLPNCDIEIVYGSTEAEPISAITAYELVRYSKDDLTTGLCVGKPFRLAEVRVIHIVDGPISCSNEVELLEMSLAIGDIGEIIVRGPHVLTAYYNNPKAFEENKINYGEVCWHRTGDSGYLDESGKLFLTGRCSALITHDGKVLAPFIYENYLKNIDGVEIGTILELKGEVWLFIELTNNSWKEKVDLALRESIDLTFDDIKYVRRIPRDPRHHSKIDYTALSQLR